MEATSACLVFIACPLHWVTQSSAAAALGCRAHQGTQGWGAKSTERHRLKPRAPPPASPPWAPFSGGAGPQGGAEAPLRRLKFRFMIALCSFG